MWQNKSSSTCERYQKKNNYNVVRTGNKMARTLQRGLKQTGASHFIKGHRQQSNLNFNTDLQTKDNITEAIISLKSGKRAGIDRIQAELLKIDLTSATIVLYNLLNSNLIYNLIRKNTSLNNTI